MTDAPLLAPIAQRELAKAYSRQPPAWRPLTIRIDPTHFGRKRRARRARGRRIETRQKIPRMVTLNWRGGQPCGPSEGLSQRLIRSHCADAARFLAPLFHSTLEGSGILTVEQWAAARRTISRQQESPTNH